MVRVIVLAKLVLGLRADGCAAATVLWKMTGGNVLCKWRMTGMEFCVLGKRITGEIMAGRVHGWGEGSAV